MPSKDFLYHKKIHCEDTGEDCIGYVDYLESKHWEMLRSKLIGKNSKCHKCGREGAIQLHHLTYEHLGRETEKDFIFLCPECHKRLHKKRAKAKRRKQHKGSHRKSRVIGESDLKEVSANKVIRQARKIIFDCDCKHYICDNGIEWCDLGYRRCPFKKCGEFAERLKSR